MTEKREKLKAGVYIVDGYEAVLRLEEAAAKARLLVQVPEQIASGERVRAGDVWGYSGRPDDADAEQYLSDGWRVTVV